MKVSLKALRVNSGFSQNDVAKRIGVTKKTVGNWEKGITSMDIDKLMKICDLYGCNINDIDLKKSKLN